MPSCTSRPVMQDRASNRNTLRGLFKTIPDESHFPGIRHWLASADEKEHPQAAQCAQHDAASVGGKKASLGEMIPSPGTPAIDAR